MGVVFGAAACIILIITAAYKVKRRRALTNEEARQAWYEQKTPMERAWYAQKARDDTKFYALQSELAKRDPEWFTNIVNADDIDNSLRQLKHEEKEYG